MSLLVEENPVAEESVLLTSIFKAGLVTASLLGPVGSSDVRDAAVVWRTEAL